MSKYDNLWKYAKDRNVDTFKLTFDEIEKVAGLPIDHSFLNYKKELLEYGYSVGKISLKEKQLYLIKVKIKNTL